MIAEEDFRRVIVRERKRTERTRKPCMLLLLDMGDSVPSQNNGKILASEDSGGALRFYPGYRCDWMVQEQLCSGSHVHRIWV
jgi:hypothetical protein